MINYVMLIHMHIIVRNLFSRKIRSYMYRISKVTSAKALPRKVSFKI